ncbi:MAG: type IV secretory system conjugative DNA transfer family protein [Solirubrobacteraceae bacterium]
MSRERTGGPSDGAMLALIGGLLAVVMLVWVWGGLAGAAFGRGWPHASLGDLVTVATRLPSHLEDPAVAWPPRQRAGLPGPAGFYAALAALLLAGVALVALAKRVSPSAGWRTLAGADGARWASSHELRLLRAGLHERLRTRTRRGARPGALTGSDTGSDTGGDVSAGRLALGRHRGRILYAERRHALIAFGPPQSGKSAGLAIPALLEWAGPAIASSIKVDLLGATLARRRALGEALVFDPFALAGMRSHTWSPLRGAASWDGALEVAWRMAAAGELDQRGVEGGDFWAIAAEQRLAPLLFTAARAGAGIERVVRWVYGQGTRDLDIALEQLANTAGTEQDRREAQAAYDAVRAFEAQADRTRSSIEATAQALLRAYRFNRVARSADGCEITADRLLQRSSTLYLIGDAKASKLLRPIFLALLSEVIDRAYELANEQGGRLSRPLLVCLDEAGNVAPLPNLAEIASTAPSHNIQLVSIFHDLAQARSRYRQQAETVVNSHRARMLLPGVADLDTLRYFAGLIGEEERRELTRTTGSGGTTRSVARRRRPLLAAEALRQLPEGHALVLYGRLAPVRVALRMWFKDRRLRGLAAGRRQNGSR